MQFSRKRISTHMKRIILSSNNFLSRLLHRKTENTKRAPAYIMNTFQHEEVGVAFKKLECLHDEMYQ